MNLQKHIKEHAALDLPEAFAIVDVSPDTAQVMCSPITGDPDPNNEVSICGIQHIVTGFLMPKAGIITEIHFVTQNNPGAGTNRNIRYSICSLDKDPTASTGLKHRETILTGVTPVSDNTPDGDVTLASGLNIPVPSQFVIAIKGPFQGVNFVAAQNCLSGGPIPGVVGIFNGGLVSAATYTFQSLSFDSINPPVIPVGDKLGITVFKALSVYVKWKGE